MVILVVQEEEEEGRTYTILQIREPYLLQREGVAQVPTPLVIMQRDLHHLEPEQVVERVMPLAAEAEADYLATVQMRVLRVESHFWYPRRRSDPELPPEELMGTLQQTAGLVVEALEALVILEAVAAGILVETSSGHPLVQMEEHRML